MFNKTTGRLQSFRLPDSIKRINGQTIILNNLLTYKIPEYITRIEDFCFSDCEVLSKIEIPSSVLSIGDYCFTNCSQLFSITISSMTKTFGKNCFQGCPKLDISKHVPLYPKDVKNDIELTKEQIDCIEQWTKKQMDKIIFDSTIDSWSMGMSVFHEKLLHKKEFVIIVETQDDIRFGCYIQRMVEKNGMYRKIYDSHAFAFTFMNKDSPAMYEIKTMQTHKALEIFGPNWYMLFSIGDDVYVGKEDCICSCSQNKDKSSYEYRGVEKALIGKVGENSFIPKRIQVIQMK